MPCVTCHQLALFFSSSNSSTLSIIISIPSALHTGPLRHSSFIPKQWALIKGSTVSQRTPCFLTFQRTESSRTLATTFQSGTSFTVIQQPLINMKEKVCLIGSGNWGSVISKIIGENVMKRKKDFDTEVRMVSTQELLFFFLF